MYFVIQSCQRLGHLSWVLRLSGIANDFPCDYLLLQDYSCLQVLYCYRFIEAESNLLFFFLYGFQELLLAIEDFYLFR